MLSRGPDLPRWAGHDAERARRDTIHVPHRCPPSDGVSPAPSAHAGRMTESDVKHAAFRLEHTVRWNPSVPYVRAIRVDPPRTHEEARKLVAAELPPLTKAR